MDQRNRYRHLHYIRAIKKGTVVELMNQSPSGIPARKFRDIKDILGDEDSFRDISIVARNGGKKSCATSPRCSEVGMKILFCTAGDSTQNDLSSDEAALKTSADDFSSYDLTLKQLKEICKRKNKRRKTHESDVGNEPSHVEKESSDFQPNDDELDLILPLRCLLSTLGKKRKVNVVENPHSFAQEKSTPFQNTEHVTPVESTTEYFKLADSGLPTYNSCNEVDNSDSSYSSCTLTNIDPTCGDLPGMAAKTDQCSMMMPGEHDFSIVQNKESLCAGSECSTIYPPSGLMAIHEDDKQEYYVGTCHTLLQECLDHQPVSKVSAHEDDRVTPHSDVCSYGLSSSMDLASHEHDTSQTHRITDEIVSPSGNDSVTPHSLKATMEGEIFANTAVVCQGSSQLCPSPVLIMEMDVQEYDDVDHRFDEHGNFEPHCIGNEMDSQGLDNLVKSDYHPDRSTINKDTESLPNHGKEEIRLTYLSDVPSDASTFSVDHTSNNDIDVAQCNANQMTPNDLVNQQPNDQPVTGPAYMVNVMGEYLHMVKENIEDAETSNVRDSMITNSQDDVCRSACYTWSCYSDNPVPANKNTEAEEQLSAISCVVTETTNCTDCDYSNKPFELETESYQRSTFCDPSESFSSVRKNLPPLLQKKLWKTVENMDYVESREQLRALGKLFADNQIKHKKPSTVKGRQIKRHDQVTKHDIPIICKHSEKKNDGSINEQKLGGNKTPRLPSTLARGKKWGSCIRNSPKGAIVFSKRQMQDTEALAKRLTNELTRMKEIIEERLNSETGTTDHNHHQVITAIDKASKAEEMSRKWLSEMNKECKRFCTIMEMSDKISKDPHGSTTIAQKKDKRKIRFADETGGQLCHIKFIENVKVSPAADV